MNDNQAYAIEYIHTHGNQGMRVYIDGRTLHSAYKNGWIVDTNFKTVVTNKGYRALAAHAMENVRANVKLVKEWGAMGVDTWGAEGQAEMWTATANKWAGMAEVEA